MNRLRLPRRLCPGDTVALLSPASPPARPALIDAGVRRLQAMGWQVRLGRFARRRTGYLAGTDRERAADLMEAFADPDVRAVFFTRGGYGISRVLEHIDLRGLRRHPKIVVGFSDLTLLHLDCQAAGLVTFWGPMWSTQLPWTRFTLTWMLRALTGKTPLGRLPRTRGAGVASVLSPGKATGPLTGGTLSLLAASLGTPYELHTHGRIVFLEDIGEEPYRVDRMLTQLLAAGKLADAAGIVLGVFKDCESKRPPRDSRRLRWVLADRLGGLGIPVLGGAPLGHMADQVTLPYGVQARIDTRRGRFEILEACVV